MRKKYYLILSENKHGKYYIGTNSSGFPKELKDIPKGFCYTSEKRAANVAAKHNGSIGGLYERETVIEVPEGALIEGEYYLSPECMHFAEDLLKKHNWSEDTYKGKGLSNICAELFKLYPGNNMPFKPYTTAEVARCLRKIGETSLKQV